MKLPKCLLILALLSLHLSSIATAHLGRTDSSGGHNCSSASIYVNDAWVDNENEEFPILVFNDITYFPMTWHYAVDELGLTIKNENNSFYISK